MKMIHSLVLAIPLLLGSHMASAAPAGDHDHGHDRHLGHGRDRHGDRYERHDGREHRRYEARYRHDNGHHWARGHRYGGPVYVVHDYRQYRLRTPPRGYRWVRADNNDYLLVAIATGIILDVVLN